MDKLAIKTEKVNVVSTYFSHANKEIDVLKSKQALIKSCVADVNYFLQKSFSKLVICCSQFLLDNIWLKKSSMYCLCLIELKVFRHRALFQDKEEKQ